MTMGEVAELVLHEWGLPWHELEATWTDEQLEVYMRSLARRLEREQRERVQLAVLLARAMGADVRMPEPDEPAKPRDDSLEAALRRWGGEVEEV
jgi:hypothetical protein